MTRRDLWICGGVVVVGLLRAPAFEQTCGGARSSSIAPFQLRGRSASATPAAGSAPPFSVVAILFGLVTIRHTTFTTGNLSAPSFGGGVETN